MKDEYYRKGRVNQKLETRSRILTSAQYFLKKGQEFTLENVAKKAGISRATIYRYYSNVEILSIEAGLDVATKSPQAIYENLGGMDFEESVLEIQDYFNQFTLKHEHTFRKYLSAVISPSSLASKRGARRKKTLSLALQNTNFTAKEKKDLANLLTILMGMEPLIVTKDVTGLNNKESMELLKWGAQLILNGFLNLKEMN